MKRVYLAGPINGRSDEECKTWRRLAKRLIPGAIDPMDRDCRGQEDTKYRDLVTADKLAIDCSDVLLVYHDRPSVGTSMEVLYAWERGKGVVVVDVSGQPLSPWLRYHSHRIVTNLNAGIQEVLTW